MLATDASDVSSTQYSSEVLIYKSVSLSRTNPYFKLYFLHMLLKLQTYVLPLYQYFYLAQT